MPFIANNCVATLSSFLGFQFGFSVLVVRHLDNRCELNPFSCPDCWTLLRKKNRSCKFRRTEANSGGHKLQMHVSCYTVNDTLLFKLIIKWATADEIFSTFMLMYLNISSPFVLHQDFDLSVPLVSFTSNWWDVSLCQPRNKLVLDIGIFSLIKLSWCIHSLNAAFWSLSFSCVENDLCE